jgi:hypothetical protein
MPPARIQSSENLAALIAPKNQQSVHLQRVEDSYLRRMWRVINAFGKIREGILQKKMLIKYVRSRYVYENKQISDRMPGNNSDIYVLDSDICV